MRAIRTFIQAARDLYEDLMFLCGVSVVWWLANLVLIPGPPATAGLYYLAHRIVREQRVDFSFFRQAFKERFGRSWLVAGISTLVLIILAANIAFYIQFESWVRYAAVVCVYFILVWLTLQIYLFPLMSEMAEPRLGRLLRNGLILVLARPGYTVMLLIVLAVTTLLCIVLPFLLLLVWPALVALVSARATMTLLEDLPQRRSNPPVQGT
ncbi:MAG TPA: DUF624 domain-containing protein [Anaerolineae bacterium]|nr:DUF624 domain-containing protein [Anaerolineae bacterium]